MVRKHICDERTMQERDSGDATVQAQGQCYQCGSGLVPGLATCPHCGARNAIHQMNSAAAKHLINPPTSTIVPSTSIRRRSEEDMVDHAVRRSIVFDIFSTFFDTVLWIVMFRWLHDRDH